MESLLLCLLVALASFQLVSCKSDMTCPKQKAQGCYCMQHSYLFRGPYVSCSKVSDVDDFHNRLCVLKNNPIDGFRLDNISLPYFPRDGSFEEIYLQTLWLYYSDLEYIASPDEKGPSPFVGLEDSVTDVKIEGLLKLVNMDWSEFSILKKLTSISLYNLNLQEIGESFSKLPASLRNFDLLNGRVTRIAPGAFDLDGLVSVAVQGNQIDKLDRNIFGSNSNLTSIMFSMNKVKEISDDFLDNLPALNFVDIGRNQLTRLPSSLRTNWAQFENIYLAGNPLICDCNLVWLLRAAKTQPPKYGDLEFVKCGSPQNLKGRELLTLNETDLCP